MDIKRRIAIIDDETTHIRFYMEALNSYGYEAIHFKSPSSCLSALERGEQFDLFICDLMMPSRGIYTLDQTHDNLITGALLTVDLKKRDLQVPTLVLTNLNIESVLNKLKRLFSEYENIFLMKKSDYDPSQLALAVRALLESGMEPGERGSILKKLWESLILQPNFMGLGLDIKKLISK